jgi:hypothetical protein
MENCKIGIWGQGIKVMIGRLYRRIAAFIAAPLYLSYFFDKNVGHEYRLGILDKIRIILSFRRNTKKIKSATSWLEHLCIAAEILKIPSTVKGDVIECGCFKGASSTNLSIICDIVGRKLILCDSFEGLPAPDEEDEVHYNILQKRMRFYEKGHFTGGLDEVRHNIDKFGKVDVCEFVKGYYSDTLKKLKGSYVLAFVDVDLNKSLKECLRMLWPRLVEGAYLFSHEAQDITYTSIFFDMKWWFENFNCSPPGFIGAGTGLPLGIGQGSGLGYALKIDLNKSTANWQRIREFRLGETQ